MNLDANNLYGWAVSQRLPVNAFKWMKHLSEFGQRFVKNYDENNDKGYILEVDVEYSKIYLIAIVIYHFQMKETKLKNVKSLFVTYITKKAMLDI